MKQEFLGYNLERRSRDEILDSIIYGIQSAPFQWLACLNPHSYAVARRQPTFMKALRSSDYLVPDGIGVVLASSLLGKPVFGRITGHDIFEGTCARLNAQGHGRVFFLGSNDSTLARIRGEMTRRWPKIEVVGCYSPPFKEVFSDSDNRQMVNAINAVKPDVLWVGMTAPKQELWLDTNSDQLCVGFAAAIGAVFDFFAGTVRRPSPFVQRLGLEWFERLWTEPRRLWRRTLISLPIFTWDVLREWFRK